MNDCTPLLTSLAVLWRSRACDLRRWAAAEPAATAYELAAQELEEQLSAASDRLVGAAEAAALVGRHRDTIGNALRDGRLTNHGGKHRPLVRVGELLVVFGSNVAAAPGNPYDANADARTRLGIR